MDVKNKIKVIIPFYNPGDLMDNCIASVLTQDYDNFEVLFIDDASIDGSYDKIPAGTYKVDENGNPVLDESGKPIIEYAHPLLKKTKCSNVIAWRASERIGMLGNIHNAVINFSNDEEDIIVICNGCDSLMKGALSYINDLYNDTNAWVVYGGSKSIHSIKSAPYGETEFKHIRSFPIRVNNLMTFKKKAYQAIIEQDKTLDCFKLKNKEWISKSWIDALFIPLLEVSGLHRICHNVKPIHITNVNSEDFSDDETLQIRQKKKFNIKL
jgi:glycosyltransferase involved in cell wall biosynthesis